MCMPIKELHAASAAEDFFAALDVPFDPAVVRVKRLHILQRFRTYLDEANAVHGCGGDPDPRATYRTALERAYHDFINADPLTERVFKVLREAVPAPAFVAVAAIERLR